MFPVQSNRFISRSSTLCRVPIARYAQSITSPQTPSPSEMKTERASLSASELKRRYNLLHSASTPMELQSAWKRLHRPFGRPLFSECCKMMGMLSSMKWFVEIPVVYAEALAQFTLDSAANGVSAESVFGMMRCSKMAGDWSTMNRSMGIHIESGWPFHKMSARFALECCFRSDGVEAVEETVMGIWRSLMVHDVPNEHCFIQFALCLKLKFVDVDRVRMAMEEILEDIDRSLMIHGLHRKSPLIAVIFSELMDCAERHRLDDIAQRIADRMMSAQSIWWSMANDVATRSMSDGRNRNDHRYGAAPLRFIVKLLSFYDRTLSIDRVHDLFVAIKRFRNLSLRSHCGNDLHFKIWEKELWNGQSLPILAKIHYQYFYDLALCGNDAIDGMHSDSHSVPTKKELTRYRDEAESICKYINYSISTPMASLYLAAIDYMMERTESANAAMFRLTLSSFSNSL